MTSDLDEYLIAALADAPVDVYGVGSRVATGSGHPTAGMVYKLVAVADTDEAGAALRPVAKTAVGKVSLGGHKTAYRELGADGRAVREVVVIDGVGAPPAGVTWRPLQVPVLRAGAAVHQPTLTEIRAHHATVRAELAGGGLEIADGDPALTATPATATSVPTRPTESGATG